MTDAGDEKRDLPSGEGEPDADAAIDRPAEGGSDEPAPDAPAPDEPMSDEPMSDEPAPDEPAADTPADEPAGDTSTLDPADPATVTLPAFTDDPGDGPQVIDGDSWDTAPVSTGNRTYAGRHHVEPSPVRRWAVVGAILVALGATVTLPYVLSGSPENVSADPVPSSTAAGPTASETGEAMSVSSTPTPSLTPTPNRTPTTTPTPRTTTQPVTTTASPPQTSTSTQPPQEEPPPFETLTLEAEDGELFGCADDEPYANASGGRIVMRIGDWCASDGVLVLRDIVIPTNGTYRITISYVHPNGDQNRHARITITGLDTIYETFEGGSSCCLTKVMTVQLSAGTKDLTIEGQEHRWRDRAPSVDKIVISRA